MLDGKMPFEALYGHAPDLLGLRLWGCTALVHNTNGSKLDVHAHEGHWLGFDVNVWAHHVFWPGPGNVTVEWNIYFGTSALPEGQGGEIPAIQSEQPAAQSTPSTPAPTTPLAAPPKTPAPPTPMPDSPPVDPPPLLHRSTRLQKPSHLMRNLQSGEGTSTMQVPGSFAEDAGEAGGAWAVIDGSPKLLEDFEGIEHALAAKTADSEALEPCSLAEAKHRPDWTQWERAINEELTTLKAAGTWRLEQVPPTMNVIGSKWVFKAKKDTTGNIACYKAHLVAQGFSQIGGVNYDNTYAPVAKLAFVHAIITMANRLGLELHQVDIKGAYLNGVLNDNKVLYMQHPPGYKVPDAGT